MLDCRHLRTVSRRIIFASPIPTDPPYEIPILSIAVSVIRVMVIRQRMHESVYNFPQDSPQGAQSSIHDSPEGACRESS